MLNSTVAYFKEIRMNRRPGCLAGLMELFLVDRIFGWAQQRFGFGRGSCCGCGCGVFLLIIAIVLVLSILTGTNWSHFGF
jgi:hypothetical protein